MKSIRLPTNVIIFQYSIKALQTYYDFRNFSSNMLAVSNFPVRAENSNRLMSMSVLQKVKKSLCAVGTGMLISKNEVTLFDLQTLMKPAVLWKIAMNFTCGLFIWSVMKNSKRQKGQVGHVWFYMNENEFFTGLIQSSFFI